MIDPYEEYEEYLDLKGNIFIVAKQLADKRLISYINKIIWKIMKSADAVNLIPDNLDFVYIDGNHSYEYVLRDIELYFPKVKEGGVVGGHDYHNESKAREVKKAVDEFTKKNQLKLHIKGGLTGTDWWVIK
ncbi:unnamed protein product [marine sediment metagenome]|uniref:Class I SAM-dependent methyltransferase n=1 Tax=marine sediment metagenome TaxID=412755 RepID=X1ASQ9_9ZZZZ